MEENVADALCCAANARVVRGSPISEYEVANLNTAAREASSSTPVEVVDPDPAEVETCPVYGIPRRGHEVVERHLAEAS